MDRRYAFAVRSVGMEPTTRPRFTVGDLAAWTAIVGLALYVLMNTGVIPALALTVGGFFYYRRRQWKVRRVEILLVLAILLAVQLIYRTLRPPWRWGL